MPVFTEAAEDGSTLLAFFCMKIPHSSFKYNMVASSACFVMYWCFLHRQSPTISTTYSSVSIQSAATLFFLIFAISFKILRRISLIFSGPLMSWLQGPAGWLSHKRFIAAADVAFQHRALLEEVWVGNGDDGLLAESHYVGGRRCTMLIVVWVR